MKAALAVAMMLALGLAAVPAAEAAPVCVTHPCGPNPVGVVMGVGARAVDTAEGAICFVGGLADLNCA
ncbi:MAG: hypothetical protein ACPGQL_08450 [Thermoplasmatota archaeon]